MASVNVDKQRPRRHPWRKSTQRLSRRLLCCCLRGEEKDPLQEQEMKINGGPQHPNLDQRGSGEREAIQITVEDLGIVNTSFSLLDEDALTPRNSMARSASSVSACPRALKKKRLKPLSSLPIQPQAETAITSTSGEDDEDEEEDPLLYESGTDSTPASGSLLTPPVINLIPPTPSDVVDDDQFFDINSEESVAHTSGSDGSFAAGDQESYEEKMESVEAEESKEGFTQAENRVSADSAAEPEESQSDQFGEEKEAVPTTEGDKEKTKPRFLRAYQVAPLPEYPQRRSFNTGIKLLSFTEHNLDDLSNRDVSCSDILKAELCLLPDAANMDTFTHQRRPITRSCSLGDTLTRSATFHALTQTTDQQQEEEGSPRQRRITVASYIPQSKDQNGNFPEKEEARNKSLAIGSLSQLVSPQSPAMLLVVQENQGLDGHYGFACCYREGSGLVVVKVDNTNLCVDDRLVEVNGVPVVNSTQEELTDLLLQGPSAQIVVLRQPPSTLTSQQQHPLLPQHMVSPDLMQTICPERDAVNMETPPRRKVMAI
ncbi:uncharacterized protein AKAME5_000855900 [Lates japonicus]|uniref:PDZ domain-containing protein n=1 Tax=Lates japonicus TaxID=270547 RepID=A0AAD3MMP9_LATJO|nr:uncharacterized protein AKAME5_000855900 [Lates japonicus]